MDTHNILTMLPLWYAAFLFSVTAHEAAHALVARLGGDDTAYLSGQVSLNPVPHIRREPFGTIFVPLLTFLMNNGQWMIGWASAPYDPAWENRHPRRAAMMALAGPAANLALVLVAFTVLKVGVLNDTWIPLGGSIDYLVAPVMPGSGVVEAIGRFLSVLLGLNLLLFVFNLIPVWPLDGGSVLAGFLPPARTLRDRMRAMPLGSLIGIVIAWLLVPYIFYPVLNAVLLLL